MKYIVNKSNDPAYNISHEAYPFKELTDIDEIFILWINEPAIIIGKNQNAIEEINKQFKDEKRIQEVRRLSGG
ncbi:lipoyl protein ligase domain-containing protein, partial [Streptococcus suis]